MTNSRRSLSRHAARLLLMMAVAAMLLRWTLHEQFGWIPVGTSAALCVVAIVVRSLGDIRRTERG